MARTGLLRRGALALVEPYLRALERRGRDVLRAPAEIAPLARVQDAAAHWFIRRRGSDGLHRVYTPAGQHDWELAEARISCFAAPVERVTASPQEDRRCWILRCRLRGRLRSALAAYRIAAVPAGSS